MIALQWRISTILRDVHVHRDDYPIRGRLVSSGLLLPLLVQGRLISIVQEQGPD